MQAVLVVQALVEQVVYQDLQPYQPSLGSLFNDIKLILLKYLEAQGQAVAEAEAMPLQVQAEAVVAQSVRRWVGAAVPQVRLAASVPRLRTPSAAV